ncbi:MAG: hypothetical protein HQL33_04280 [Alphaproteobacteria bacterium]|nr:hypothetical protein [Alphaproteobacteria bacterium]MBF0129189.1 hypothetical protein [Alphaproteobacteria bacterium]
MSTPSSPVSVISTPTKNTYTISKNISGLFSIGRSAKASEYNNLSTISSINGINNGVAVNFKLANGDVTFNNGSADGSSPALVKGTNGGVVFDVSAATAALNLVNNRNAVIEATNGAAISLGAGVLSTSVRINNAGTINGGLMSLSPGSQARTVAINLGQTGGATTTTSIISGDNINTSTIGSVANTYPGRAVFNTGTINGDIIGNGSITLAGGVVNGDLGRTATLGYSQQINVSGDSILNGSIKNTLSQGTAAKVAFTTDSTLTVGVGGSVYANVTTANNGQGNLVLNGANANAGYTIGSEGASLKSLTFASDVSTVGGSVYANTTTVAAGAVLNGGAKFGGGLTVDGTMNVINNGAWSTSGTITINGNVNVANGYFAGTGAGMVVNGTLNLKDSTAYAWDWGTPAHTWASYALSVGSGGMVSGSGTIFNLSNNAGTIVASGGTLKIAASHVSNDLGGKQVIDNNSVLELVNTASSVDVSFGVSSVLRVDQGSGVNAATLRAFDFDDTIDFQNFNISNVKLTTVANDQGSTVLNVQDGAISSKVTLFGQYAAAGFGMADNGHGGSALTYTPPQSQQIAKLVSPLA